MLPIRDLCEASIIIPPPNFSDNCGILSFSNDFSGTDELSGSFPQGNTTVVWTAEDIHGNVSTCTQVISVEDLQAPEITCPEDFSVLANEDCEFTLDDYSDQATFFDNCSADITVIQVPESGEVVFGNTVVTLIATDEFENTSSCSFNIIVEDAINPEITCPNDTIVGATNSLCEANISMDSPVFSDNCSVDYIENDFTGTNDASGLYPFGETILTWTVFDGSGNSATCQQLVTVIDESDPTITCDADVVVNNDPGSCGANIIIPAPEATDGCMVVFVENSINGTDDASGFYAIGETEIIWTATDQGGNTDQCIQTITVIDNILPEITCPDDIETTTDPGVCNAFLTLDQPVVEDECGILSITNDYNFTDNSNDTYPKGFTTIEWTVIDINGNSNTCEQNITVEDNESPNAICQDLTVELDQFGIATILESDVDNGSDDNCGIDVYSLDVTEFNSIGDFPVTLEVTDYSTNTNSCVATITVIDVIDPVADCQNTTVYLDENGQASVTADQIDNGSFDNSGNLSLILDKTDFDCEDLENDMVTLTVLDGSGNTDFCVAQITILDTINPIAVCQDITLQLDIDGSAVLTADMIDNSSFDNCTIQNIEISQTLFDSNQLGLNQVTLTVTDQSGNSGECIANVTIEDNIPPVVSCQDIQVQLNDEGYFDINVGDIEDGSSYDNSGTITFSISVDTLHCTELGENLITLYAEDGSGNVDSCMSTVTVIDIIGPEITCPNNISVNTDPGVCGANINPGVPVISDNCSNLTWSNSVNGEESAEGFFEVGETQITWTVQDQAGLTAQCIQLVTISDTEIPELECYSEIELSLIDETVQLGTDQVISTISDNCEVNYDSFSLDIDTFGFEDLGENIVSLSIEDIYGNPNECTTTVIILDEMTPTANCITDTTLYIDETGWAFLEAIEIDNGSSDIQGELDYAIDWDLFSCSEANSTITVQLTVSDTDNFSASCTTEVLILDTLSPVMDCQNIEAEINELGIAEIAISDLIGNTSDNCYVESYSVNNDTFTCNELGLQTVELTAVDPYFNESTCLSEITVVDVISPEIISCPLSQEFESADSLCGDWILLSDLEIPTGNDNCSLVSISSETINELAGEEINFLNYEDQEVMLPVGEYEIDWTLTDQSGNSSACVSTINMYDNINPIMEVEDEILLILPPDECLMDYSYIVEPEQVTDNCEVGFYTEIQSDFGLGIGTNINAYTGFDIYGNSIDEFIVQTLYIIDTVPPVIECSDTLTFYSDNDICGTEVFIDPEIHISESCEENLVIPDGYSDYFEVGTHNIEWNVYDSLIQDLIDNSMIPMEVNEFGQAVFSDTLTFDYISTCTQVIQVLDTVSPIIISYIDTFFVETEFADVLVSIPVPEVEDNCLLDSISMDLNDFETNYIDSLEFNATFSLGTSEIDWIFIDIYGNESTLTTYVDVSDIGEPIFTDCPEIIEVIMEQDCSFEIPNYSDDFEAIDTSGETPMITQSPEAGTIISTDTELTLTATDSSGNQSECTFTIVTLDTVSPLIECLESVTRCEAITPEDFPTYSDNCGNANPILAVVDGNILDDWNDLIDFPLGDTTTVEFHVVDDAANSSSCTTEVIIIGDSFVWEEIPSEICAGDQFDIVVSNPGYTWSNEFDQAYIEEGVYYGESDSGSDVTDIITLSICDQNFEQIVTINSFPEPQLLIEPELCSSTFIPLATNGFDYSEVQWSSTNPAFDFADDQQLATLMFSEETGFDTLSTTITLEVSNNGCLGSTNFDFTLYEGILQTDIEAGMDQELFDVNSVMLNGVYTGPGISTWYVAEESSDTDVSFGDIYEPVTDVSDLEMGDYYFIIVGENGVCESVYDTVNIWINGMIPNGFSPNESGSNDSFVIQGLDPSSDNELFIFNRWGSEVFYQKHYDNTWKGVNNNDQPLVDDTYFYVFRIGNKKYEGFVVIKRN